MRERTVVILTSNIGSQYLGNTTGVIGEEEESLVMAALRDHFKPELLNRLDDIIMFHSLTIHHFEKITEKYVKQALRNLPEIKGSNSTYLISVKSSV